MKVLKKDRKTIFDIAIQNCGDADSAFDIAYLNDDSVTGLQQKMLDIPDIADKRVVSYYKLNRVDPATDDDESYNIITYDGELMETNEGNLMEIM